MSPAVDGRTVRAITFDFWDTLRPLRHRVVPAGPAHRGGRRAARHGLPAEQDAIEAAFDEAWRRFDAAWGSNQQFTGHQAAEAVLEVLGHDPEPEIRKLLVEAYLGANGEVRTELTPNVADTLRRLKTSGIKVGIICDVGLTPSPALRQILDRHGVLGLFDHWAFSDEVGTYKPDPAIFGYALEGLGGIDPADAAHIGDLRRTDVAGALGMGILALRYRGITDDDPAHGPEGDAVVADHADVPGLLGVTQP